MSPPPFRRGRRPGRDLRSRVVRGEHVELDLLLRRTSARGWGPWTEAILILGPLPDRPVSWHVADPVAVGLPVTRGPVSADFTDIERVQLRPVRFRSEAFWELDGDIIVLQAERATTELALPRHLTGPVHDRLLAQLLGADAITVDVIPADVIPADVIPADVIPADVNPQHGGADGRERR